jgi:hypothetical protein
MGEKKRTREESIELLDKFIRNHLEDFKRYYEMLKEGKLLIMNHNYIPHILLGDTNNFNEWIELVKKVYGPYFNPPQRTEKKLLELKSKSGLCTCNFDRVYPITGNNIAVSQKGTPPDTNLCPFGLLTLLSFANINKYIYLSPRKIEEKGVVNEEIIPGKLYLVISPHEIRDNNIETVYRRDPSGGSRYRPIDRATT